MPFIIGESVGPYKIVAQLGQGGMATVFKAHHAALDRFVAIKVLHPDISQDPTFTERFKREARLVAWLDHPNIVPVHDFADEGGFPYLVMKFIEGETLRERLARGPLSREETSLVVVSIGAALGFAHKKGILHRDIKPSNVLLSENGHVYLADFGLARIQQQTSHTLTAGAIIGTPYYLSPEQAAGKTGLDEGTDIYSFGVMLYEMVVGRTPFIGETPLSVIYDHISKPPPLPRSINPNVTESVEGALMKALSKERAERYATVGEMAAAFKSAWEEKPLPPTVLSPHKEPAPPIRPPESRGPQPVEGSGVARPVKQKRPLWATIGAAALLALCCAGLLLWRAFNGTPLVISVINPTPTALSAYCSGDQTWLSRDYFPEQEINYCWEQGHFITDLAFDGKEWTLVMGKNVAYTEQTYLADYAFPSAGVKEHWDGGFDITDVFHVNGQWVAVMSKGTVFSDQSYLFHPAIPEKEIIEYWNRDYSITSLAYGNGEWYIVLSQGAGLGVQVYFSDPAFPEALVRQYWDSGYDITSLAYGNAGWTVVMSQKSGYSDQAYYWKDLIPEDGISADWDSDFYITNLDVGNSRWVVVMSK